MARSRTASYEKIGIKMTGNESLEQAAQLIYPEVLVEQQIAPLGSNEAIPDKKAIYAYNPKTESAQYISTVGNNYGLVQPYDSIKDMQSYLDNNDLRLTYGGKLDGGKKMFLLSDVANAEAEIVRGDIVKLSILRSGSFDGTSKDRYDGIIQRLVCTNGAKMDEVSFSLSFKHTARIHQKIESARDHLQAAIVAFKKQTEKMKHLASKKVTNEQIKTFVRNVIVFDGAGDINTRTENTINSIIELAHNGTGMELVPAVRGTAWAAFNAVTEYTTHEYGRNDDSRLQAQWFGASAKLNNRAMDLALAM